MKVYVDGGCRPNPGKMAIAITDQYGNPLSKKFLGDGTNNEAEYLAVIKAIELAKDKGETELTIYTDSQLVANQLKPINPWKVNNPTLRTYIEIIKGFSNMFFKKFGIVQIPREKNLAGKIIEKMWRSSV
ncbi:MAG: ribonuclease HI family protein [Methanophagales archaeon]|nr:ribonuclease HI family protein [Methanophagales archaeon]